MRYYYLAVVLHLMLVPACCGDVSFDTFQTPRSVMNAGKVSLNTPVQNIMDTSIIEIGQRESSKTSDDFFIFVSFSLHERNLRQIIEDARRYGAFVVIRGLKNNSMRETVQYLLRSVMSTGQGVLVDPTLFQKFGIRHVPSFVLYDGSRYDMLSGNVTVDFALRKFAERGDLKVEAKRRLEL